MKKREFKSVPFGITKALNGDAANGSFQGYASTYNVDLQGDKIMPGAFAQSIKDKKGQVPIFYGHSEWIGISTALAEDGKGLAITGELALDNSIAKNAYALLQKAAELDFRVGLSIGFTASEVDYDDAAGVRIIREIDLWEVSVTPFPAQPKAYVSDVKTWRDLEDHLREAEGFSRAEAKRIINALSVLQLPSCGRPDGEPDSRHSRLLAGLSNPLAL